MKPAVCYLCGKSALDEDSGKKGDWVEFRDYREKSDNCLSHPVGLKYFCNEHFLDAKRLRHKKSNEALAELRCKFPIKKHIAVEGSYHHSWWKRWISC